MAVTTQNIPRPKLGLIDGDLLVFAVCAAVEYGAEEEELTMQMFRSICKSVDSKLINIIQRLELEDVLIFFSHSNNFRHTLMPEYKANRKDVWRPHFLSDAKEHVMQWWESEMQEGLEADDLMAYYQVNREEYSTVIVTIDKDLLQVPGHHYRWETEHRGEESLIVQGYGSLKDAGKKVEGNGEIFFLHQCLIGDPTDGIMGCGKLEDGVYKSGAKCGEPYKRRKGIGAKQSLKLLKDTKNYQEGLGVVIKQYKEIFGDDWEEQLLSQAGCVWMVRDMHYSEKQNLQFPVMWDFSEDRQRAYHPIKKVVATVPQRLRG